MKDTLRLIRLRVWLRLRERRLDLKTRVIGHISTVEYAEYRRLSNDVIKRYRARFDEQKAVTAEALKKLAEADAYQAASQALIDHLHKEIMGAKKEIHELQETAR